MMRMPFAPASRAHVCAAPDTTRSTAAPAPVLEMVTFELNDGADPDDFVTASKGTERVLRERGAIVRRFLTVDDKGLWADVIEWSDMEAALDAAKVVMGLPEFAPVGAMIKPGSVTMRHAPILWRMD